MMDFKACALFVEVARARSFAAVARDRAVDPSSVSRAVAALEAALGVRLFQRTTRSMVLTETGELYLQRLPALLAEFGQLREEAALARVEPVGTVRLTASVAFSQFCIVPLLPEFADRYPKLSLELITTDSNVDLVADRIDLAVRLGPGHRADVSGEQLFPTRYRVVASPDYVARRGRPSAPAKLSAHSCLTYALPGYRTRWIFRDAAGEQFVPIAASMVISGALALRQATLDGIGPALLANWLIDRDLEAGRLIDLFPSHQVTATTFETAAWLLCATRDLMPRKVKTTADFLRTRLRRERR
jgi:DNA-binding transcriptional LysR family regulator